MIITEIKQLQLMCEEVKTVKEGEEIGAQLLKELTETKQGIGLAANQIGINKRVCVINVKEPIYFINPSSVDKSSKTFFSKEGCLSFPNKHSLVARHSEITVEADNFEGNLVFSAETGNQNDMLECACIQHEIDHLDGITMF